MGIVSLESLPLLPRVVPWMWLTATYLFSMKASGEQLDDRIVEVHWDPELEGWRMMRFRDDKPNGNHRDVVTQILKSIADGIEKDLVSATRRVTALPGHSSPCVSAAALALEHDPERVEESPRAERVRCRAAQPNGACAQSTTRLAPSSLAPSTATLDAYVRRRAA